MLRKLASIRKVRDIKPIKDADAIELAIVDGWQVVVKKGQFKLDELVVYVEIDSFLPERSEFEFLRKSSHRTMADGSTGFRLKTVRLRGQLSQGLILPLNEVNLSNVNLGDEVTEQLGIKKYEPPIPACLAGEMRGAVPGEIHKSDQERIHNLLNYWTIYKDLEFEETEKLNGASMTVYHNQGDTGVCGHKWNMKETKDNTLWKVSRRLELTERLTKLGLNLALQGEIIGEGIQSNWYKIIGQTFKIYDIWDIDNQYYLTNKERLDIIQKLGFDLSIHVPILNAHMKIFDIIKDVNEFLEYSTGISKLANVQREGLVYKSTERVGPQTISFKVLKE
jgi:RNA ligase (TIGR02306 family)